MLKKIILSLLITTCAFSYEEIEDLATTPILNPNLAERQTAKIRLDNGLEAYLVSDPKTSQSAAMLAVNVGSWHDLPEYPGMAHYLEHLLFMGTEKYPDEGEHLNFIISNGGKPNAYTAVDTTAYMYTINHEAYEESLDRFSQFFIAPLFNPASIKRELTAVDQEHAKNIENDMFRRYQIGKETCNPDHPHTKFSTGTAETLSHIPLDVLKEWYCNYYSADRMRLVLISPLSIEKQIELTEKLFSPIKKSSHPLPSIPSTLCSEKQLGAITYIKPIQQLRYLTLCWELPSQFKSIEGKTSRALLTYALNNKGKNGLLELLKQKQIANDIGAFTYDFKDHPFIGINLNLTEEGQSKIDTATTFCFQALQSAKITPELAEEYNTIQHLHYQFQQREDPFDALYTHAHRIFDEDIATYPEQNFLAFSYDQNNLNALLDLLTPDACTITAMGDPDAFNITLDRKEQWSGAQYTVQPLSQETLTSLNSLSAHPSISAPIPNPYLPSNLEPVNPKRPIERPSPTVLEKSAHATIYYAPDHLYHLPETYCALVIKSPAITPSPRSTVLTQLAIALFNNSFSENNLYAQNAGLSHSLYLNNLQLNLTVFGYSEKIPTLLNDILTKLTTFNPSETEFTIEKQNLYSCYQNELTSMPMHQAINNMNIALSNDIFTTEDKLEALFNITYSDLIQHLQQLFLQTHTQGIYYGNITKKQAQTSWKQVKKHITNGFLLPNRQPKKQLLLLPENQGPYQLSKPSITSGQALLLTIDQGPYTFETRAIQQILSSLLSANYFDTLRTKQQIAYAIKAWDTEDQGRLFQNFIVQSASHSAPEILARTELFLEELLRNLPNTLTEEKFNTLRQAQINKLKNPPESLADMGNLLEKIILDHNADFKHIEKRIAALENITYEQVLAAAYTYFSHTNQKRLAILIDGPIENPFQYQPISQESLREVGMFTP